MPAGLELLGRKYYRIPRFTSQLIQCSAKMFGRKSGKGYYRYADGKIISDENYIPETAQHKYIQNRILCMLMNLFHNHQQIA